MQPRVTLVRMPRLRDNFRVASRVMAVFCLLVVGCAKHTPVQRQIEAAPFEVAAEGRLRVREDLVPALKAVPVRQSDVVAELEGFGKLEFAPGASYAIRVPFDGIIESVAVEAGTKVVPDQVVARVRSSELAKLRADLRRLGALLSSDRETLPRLQELLSKGATNERSVVEAKSRLKALEAETEGVQNALAAARVDSAGGDLFELRAPYAGEILIRNIEPGENVETADAEPAFIVGDPQKLIVLGSFPERDVPLLVKGESCTVIVPALSGLPLPGHITSVVGTIEPNSRTIQVICALDSADHRLRAQMGARISVRASGPPCLVVPRSAVLLRRDTFVVLVRHGEREIERRTVQTGLNLGKELQILSGLKEGEQVITEGAVLLDGEFDRVL